jgi:hypothetical protein
MDKPLQVSGVFFIASGAKQSREFSGLLRCCVNEIGSSWWESHLLDESQLDEVKEYYNVELEPKEI